ncbi:MAG: nucleotidyltransferase family protein [Bacteroidota bacterium]|nr:nucleotidyltransferase family protein [Bacteroidota bacterium]
MQRTPEEQLLLAVLKLDTSKIELEHIESLARQINDWESFSTLAIKRAIGPLLYKKLSTLPYQEIVPQSVMNKLKQVYFKTFSRNTLYYEHLRRILDVFSKAGIEVIVLKGIYLTEWLYKDIGLRQLSDIDLLIKEEKIEKSIEIMEKLGYKAAYPIDLSIFLDKNFHSQHLPQMTYQGVAVEIHFKILNSWETKSIDLETVWNRAIQTSIYGINVLSLNLTDLLIHLSLHLDKHYRTNRVQFGWYADITNILEKYALKIDWNEIEEKCNTANCTKRFFLQIMLCHHFIGAIIPKDITNKYNYLVTTKESRLFDKLLIGKSHKSNRVSYYFSGLSQLSSIRAKSKYLFHLLFPSKEFMMYRYPVKRQSLFFLYYPHRLFIGIKSAWKYLRNK